MPAPAAKSQPGTLRVGTIGVAAPYRGKALVFRQSELGYDADFYTEFLVAPSPMIGEATARALEGARVFARVIPPGAPPDGDWVLDGFVGALYGDRRDPARPAAELAITWYLSRADAATSTPFWSKEYRRRVPVSGTTADAHADAIVRGAGRDRRGTGPRPRRGAAACALTTAGATSAATNFPCVGSRRDAGTPKGFRRSPVRGHPVISRIHAVPTARNTARKNSVISNPSR